jgi:glycogen operon protein
VRDFWRGEPSSLGEFAARFTGSSDLYETDNRRPIASINFVTAHDGFTLSDLVSYNEKHNEANGEDNADGESHNRSWNHGVEGETDDPAVLELRERQKRNILTTLLLSQGVPMIAHGDELGRTQQGNNNVYCQDNALSWVDWERAHDNDRLVAFTARLARLRAEHPIFRRQRFFQGRPLRGQGVDDIAWLGPDAQPMSDEDWDGTHTRTLTVYLNGRGIPDRDDLGVRVEDDSFLLLVNAQHEQQTVTVPDDSYGSAWRVVIDTAAPDAAFDSATPDSAAPGEADPDAAVQPGQSVDLPPRSMLVLQSRPRGG